MLQLLATTSSGEGRLGAADPQLCFPSLQTGQGDDRAPPPPPLAAMAGFSSPIPYSREQLGLSRVVHTTAGPTASCPGKSVLFLLPGL